ncbi:hypothetical protein MTO98_25475 [Mucilaginibacter sp. SMC90]|nr:hypothetical protein [Mucilaginibacter sp. SMC90]UOE47766.1 hypothetical protein MTO98_25475 [Mucilaginibacter sp. SMC90]
MRNELILVIGNKVQVVCEITAIAIWRKFSARELPAYQFVLINYWMER